MALPRTATRGYDLANWFWNTSTVANALFSGCQGSCATMLFINGSCCEGIHINKILFLGYSDELLVSQDRRKTGFPQNSEIG